MSEDNMKPKFALGDKVKMVGEVLEEFQADPSIEYTVVRCQFYANTVEYDIGHDLTYTNALYNGLENSDLVAA